MNSISKKINYKNDIFASLGFGLFFGFIIAIIRSIIFNVSNNYIEQKMYNLIIENIISYFNICIVLIILILLLSIIIKNLYQINSIKRGILVFLILTLIFYLFLHISSSLDFPEYIKPPTHFPKIITTLFFSIIVFIILKYFPLFINYLMNRAKRRAIFLNAKFIGCAFLLLLITNSIYYIYKSNHVPKGPNIILIVIDTLRADHLSIYDYKRKTSPNIDELYENSVLFVNAVSQTPFTMPSVASIFTSENPYRHGVRDHPDARIHLLKKDSLTLSEIMKNEGYVTSAFIANWLISPKKGYAQGFDNFKYVGVAKEVTNQSIDWLNKNSKNNFFLYLHFIDPHLPYSPPNDHIFSFDSDYKGKFKYSFSRQNKDSIFINDLSENDFKHAIALYDEEIKYTDTQIGVLLNKLVQMKIYDNTLIILTSDHGESLGEHGVNFAHDFYLYDPMINVPLLIKFPSQKYRMKKINDVVRIIDIMPTIIDILNLSNVPSFQGVSLLPSIDSNEKLDLLAYSETCSYRPNYGVKLPMEQQGFYLKGIKGKWRMIRNGKWKLIYVPGRSKRLFELYDIQEDPQELHDVFYENQIIANQLKTNLFELMKEDNQSADEYTNIGKIDRETLETLKSLGYLK